jgi:hypothetical protein
MTIISKFTLIAAIAAVGIASPALAQSLNPEAGSGNVAGFSYGPTPSQNDEYVVPQSSHAKTAARQNGLHAFASVPGNSNSGSTDPAFTGGGSAGYNQMLQQY